MSTLDFGICLGCGDHVTHPGSERFLAVTIQPSATADTCALDRGAGHAPVGQPSRFAVCGTCATRPFPLDRLLRTAQQLEQRDQAAAGRAS